MRRRIRSHTTTQKPTDLPRSGVGICELIFCGTLGDGEDKGCATAGKRYEIKKYVGAAWRPHSSFIHVIHHIVTLEGLVLGEARDKMSLRDTSYTGRARRVDCIYEHYQHHQHHRQS